MAYKCGSCGHIQNHYGECANCLHSAKMMQHNMEMIENAKKISRDCREILYGDNNCFGCNKSKRRKYLIIVGTLFAIGAGVVYFGRFNEDYQQLALGLICLSGLFYVSSICPDFALLCRC